MKLVSGWHNGITGPGALVSAAARYFNEDENNVNVDLQIETYPVVFEGTKNQLSIPLIATPHQKCLGKRLSISVLKRLICL